MKKIIVPLFVLAFVVGVAVFGEGSAEKDGLEQIGENYDEGEGRRENYGEGRCESHDVDGADSDLSVQGMGDDVPQQVLRRIAYTVSYNRDTRCPNWVYWNLTAEHTTGAVKRMSKFYADEDVPEPRADWRDFKGTGWARGHMCPAGDCKWDEKAMWETFLLSNIVPQNPNLNQGDWNELETKCRVWAREFGDVHIVCGPLPYKKPWETISEHEIVVPRALFKVVLCTNGTPKAIGFIYKNQAQNNPKQYYVNTVDEVERLTGIDFFPALPDDVEEKVESKYNLSDWGL